ncbi:MAG: hypothetical protein H6Q36_119 [Chloroflexi bacterium]|nr:hypothetical protein [Chloroflexota bacterium]
MSIEVGFVLFVAHLYGPTIAWLAYRAVRGHKGRAAGMVGGPQVPASASPESAQLSRAAGVSGGFWICGTCQSLNRDETGHCYRCRTAKGTRTTAPEQQESIVPPPGNLVPVMAEDARQPQAALVAAAVAVTVNQGAAPVPEPRAAAPGSPAAAPGSPAAAPGSPAAAPAAIVGRSEAPAPAPRIDMAPPGSLGAPDPVPAIVVDVPVCPYLGFRDDPWTRCDFADPLNHCHASAQAHTEAKGRYAGVGRSRRSRPIGAEHQQAWCLTPAHGRCVHYPTASAGPPGR